MDLLSQTHQSYSLESSSVYRTGVLSLDEVNKY